MAERTVDQAIGETFRSVAQYLLASKYEELERAIAWRTTLRNRAKVDVNSVSYTDLEDIAAEIAEIRKTIRGLWKESDHFTDMANA